MTNGRTVVGVDTAKRVFQLHWVDLETGEIVDLKLTRARFLDHFANRVPCLTTSPQGKAQQQKRTNDVLPKPDKSTC